MARILVCDDSAFMRKTITDALRKDGHEIVGEAGNGMDACAQYNRLHPDIVTMDILMEPDGHEAIKRIICDYPHAKIVVITSLVNQAGEVSETVRLGGVGFVSKPLDCARLVKEIRRVEAL